MAFVMEFGTGFEYGAVPTRSGWFNVGANANYTVSATGVRTGSYALRVDGVVYHQRATPSNEIYLSIWAYPSSNDQACAISLHIGATAIIELRRSYPAGLWHAYVGGSKVADGAVATASLTLQHIQLHAIVADSGGVIETIIDGIPDISYTGDTQPGASDQIDGVGMGRSYWQSYDDFCYGTGGWPGDIRFDAVLLDGDDTVAWTPSTGTDNYALLDEVPPSSTDYVSTTVDASDLYTLAPWDDTDGSGNVVKDPIAVTLWASARKEDGNYNDQLQLRMSDGANTVQGGYETLLTSYEHRWLLRMAAPDGGEWTKAKIDDLLVGIDADMESA